MSLNSHKALCSDPVLIEDTAFLYMFLAASLEKVRAMIWDGAMPSFSTMYAIFAVMVRACAYEDQLGGLGVLDLLELAGFLGRGGGKV